VLGEFGYTALEAAGGAGARPVKAGSLASAKAGAVLGEFGYTALEAAGGSGVAAGAATPRIGW
jgi:hypothetical protein